MPVCVSRSAGSHPESDPESDPEQMRLRIAADATFGRVRSGWRSGAESDPGFVASSLPQFSRRPGFVKPWAAIAHAPQRADALPGQSRVTHLSILMNLISVQV